ncbi:MAG: acyltransferase family protein [Acidimicrobiales bacterium]
MLEGAVHEFDSTERSSPLDTDPTDTEPGHHRRTSALDGIRAFAVLAVMAYHFGVPGTSGGLLGVDVFFVLSGFLITSLICRELQQTRTIRLGRFWAQRARRLLPALFVLLIGVALYVHVFAGSIDLASVRGDAFATLTYVSNWRFILSDQGYFALAAAPSPFLHTWSLAIEEQYYLVWPLVALFVARRWGTRKVALVAAIGAAASAVLMGSMYVAGFSIERLYYGTDTRAQSLLIGSFVGAVGSHVGSSFDILPGSWTATRWLRRLWTLSGVLGALFLAWAWHDLVGQDGRLYVGGFFCVAVAAACVIIACVTFPGSALARFCSLGALVFIGRISYGLYLYHWPLYLLIDHAHTGLSGIWLLGARLLTTFAVATVSFFAIEEPIRTRRILTGRMGLVGMGTAAVVAALALFLATAAPATPIGAVPTTGGASVAQRQALTAAHAFTTRPIRFLLLGDSIALTLGVGLGVRSQPRYGVQVNDRGTLGCELDTFEVNLSGVVGPATPGCTHWRTVWKQYVDQDRPDVVGLLIGRWEVSDQLYHGNWVHIGQSAWDDHLASELDQAFALLSAGGARIIVFTMPYVDPPTEAANGTPFPENSPTRVAAFNKLLRSVADRQSRPVTVVDLNKMLDPHGVYEPDLDGIQVRWSDGIHITEEGGEWLQPRILPIVAEQGLDARAGGA